MYAAEPWQHIAATWKQRAIEAEARVQELEAENAVLREWAGVDAWAPIDGLREGQHESRA